MWVVLDQSQAAGPVMVSCLLLVAANEDRQEWAEA